MSQTLFSIVESPVHPNFSALYQRLGLKETRLESMRKAIGQLRKQVPDIVVAEFFYGYGNNYAGINISNVDVFLLSLKKYTDKARVILMVDKGERRHVDKLKEQYPIHAVLVHPVSEAQIQQALTD
jgi:hypothetical protein